MPRPRSNRSLSRSPRRAATHSDSTASVATPSKFREWNCGPRSLGPDGLDTLRGLLALGPLAVRRSLGVDLRVDLLRALAQPQTCARYHAQRQQRQEGGRSQEGLTVFVTGVEADGASVHDIRKDGQDGQDGQHQYRYPGQARFIGTRSGRAPAKAIPRNTRTPTPWRAGIR